MRLSPNNQPRMKDYNHKHHDGDEIVLIGWLIVVFSLTILYLIWHEFGYI